MNTFLSSEQAALQASCREFVKELLEPISGELEQRKHCTKELLQKFGQKGYLGLSVAKEYDGQGSSFLDFSLLVEAVSEVDAGLALSIAAHTAAMELVANFGTDTQKSRYLPLLARGECLGTVALTEEKAGSDYLALEAKVTAGAEGFSISGKKTWVINGDTADLALVVARAGDAGRLSIWLVDLAKRSDVKVDANRSKLGLKSASTNDIEFVNTAVAKDAFLGPSAPEEASDDKQVESQIKFALDVSKVLVAAAALGLLDSALDASVQRARTREQFGANIGKFQAIQWKLADMSAESSGARLLTYRAAWAKDNSKEQFSRFAAMCKLFAARAARVHSAEAVQIFGAAGVSEDEPVEKLYRDAKVLEICEGTSEIQKNIIAAEVGV